MIDCSFWKNKKVFITGHTGFKGSWLCLWLYLLGSKITGYALKPPTYPSLYDICNINELLVSIFGDIRESNHLTQSLLAAEPDIVIHMAAQSLVSQSYIHPSETYETNIMGTVNLLEALRKCPSVKAAIIVTSDKCYNNNEWYWGYRENDSLGGYDPYSSSKACVELITTAYRNSFFSFFNSNKIAIATARAGNVVGGGDWAPDRLIPDCVKAILNGDVVRLRHPNAIRPWQHVLEPLNGYLMLAESLYGDDGGKHTGAWNFGPDNRDDRSVKWVADYISHSTGLQVITEEQQDESHEATYLKLDSTKARTLLPWKPHWNLEKTLDTVVEWVFAYQQNIDMREICFRQIEDFCSCTFSQ